MGDNGGGGGDGGPDPNAEVNATTLVRLPWPNIVRENIELWFIQIEHWFAVNRITSDNTKFSAIIAALDATLLQQIYETVRNPPATGKYDAIKTAVIHNFTESEQRRAQQLVSGLQLGDKKPSHLLNELRRIGGDSQDEKLLKVLWMNRLPVQVQTCLATSSAPLNELSQLADSVMETFRIGDSFGAHAVSQSNIDAAAAIAQDDPMAKLTNQIEKLTRQLNKVFDDNQRSRSRTRSTSRQRGRSSTPAIEDDGQNDGQCWYHRTYGNDARKCRDPCKSSKN